MVSIHKVMTMSNDLNRNQSPRPSSGLAPWVNLTYPQKFTLVALIFALSLLAFLPLILEQNQRIENYGSREAQGNQCLHFVWQLSTDLQTLRIADTELQNGS